MSCSCLISASGKWMGVKWHPNRHEPRGRSALEPNGRRTNNVYKRHSLELRVPSVVSTEPSAQFRKASGVCISCRRWERRFGRRVRLNWNSLEKDTALLLGRLASRPISMSLFTAFGKRVELSTKCVFCGRSVVRTKGEWITRTWRCSISWVCLRVSNMGTPETPEDLEGEDHKCCSSLLRSVQRRRQCAFVCYLLCTRTEESVSIM